MVTSRFYILATCFPLVLLTTTTEWTLALQTGSALPKPQFDTQKSSPQVIWVNDDASILTADNPHLTVNISCAIAVDNSTAAAADTPTSIRWFIGTAGNVSQIHSGMLLPQALANTQAHIEERSASSESLLSLKLSSTDLKQLRHLELIRLHCEASNKHGKTEHAVELRAGRLPERPKISMLEYRNGFLHLTLNESTSQIPPVDTYRLEVMVGNNKLAHLFSKTALKDYIIAPSTELPPGEYHVSVAAHNSLGWSPESFNRHRSGTNFVIVPELLGKSQALPLTGSARRITTINFFNFLTILMTIFVAFL